MRAKLYGTMIVLGAAIGCLSMVWIALFGLSRTALMFGLLGTVAACVGVFDAAVSNIDGSDDE